MGTHSWGGGPVLALAGWGALSVDIPVGPPSTGREPKHPSVIIAFVQYFRGWWLRWMSCKRRRHVQVESKSCHFVCPLIGCSSSAKQFMCQTKVEHTFSIVTATLRIRVHTCVRITVYTKNKTRFQSTFWGHVYAFLQTQTRNGLKTCFFEGVSLNSRHPSPRRVWKGGSERRLRDHFIGIVGIRR